MAALALYGQTIRFDFVNLDDWTYVRDCQWLREGFTWPSFIRAFTEYLDTGCWFPLTRLSYMLDIAVFNLRPGAMHLHNAVLHAANAALVFVLLVFVLKIIEKRNLKRDGGESDGLESIADNRLFFSAAWAALFWAVHPLRVESVAWIASRKDVLSLFWELIGLIAYLYPVNGCDKRERHCMAVVAASFLLAIMAKPMAITFVLLVGLLDLFLLGQLRWKRLAILAWLTLPFVVLSIYTQQAVGNTIDPFAIPFNGRLLNAVSALGIYLKQTVWSVQLRVPCLPQWPLLPEFFWPALFCMGVGGGGIAYHLARLFWLQKDWQQGTQRLMISRQGALVVQLRAWFVLGFVGFLVSVAPTAGIVSFGYQARADRFTYLPAVWLSLSLAGGMYILFSTCGKRYLRLLTLCLCLVWLGVLAAMSYRQAGFWRDTETLSRRALKFEPDNMVAHKNLGTHLFIKRNKLGEACLHIRSATEHHPDPLMYVIAITMMIDCEEMASAKEMSAQFIAKIKERETNGWDIHYKIAYAYSTFCAGDKDLAREHFAVIADKNPTFAPVQYMMGRLFLERGDTEAAKEAWTIAAQDPLFSDWLK